MGCSSEQIRTGERSARRLQTWEQYLPARAGKSSPICAVRGVGAVWPTSTSWTRCTELTWPRSSGGGTLVAYAPSRWQRRLDHNSTPRRRRRSPGRRPGHRYGFGRRPALWRARRSPRLGRPRRAPSPLAPLDRGLALRGPALRLLRFGATWGVGLGAVFGVLASRRLGGDWPAWAASGALVGVAGVDGALGVAMAVSGARLGRRTAGWLTLAVLAWSAADVVLARASSPMSLLGQVALWPLRWRAGGLAGVAFAVLAVVSGVGLAGRTSVEASERRSSLAGRATVRRDRP